MSQGEFSKEEADETIKAVQELFEAIAKPKRLNFLGHLNDALLFLEAAKLAAPSEKKPEEKKKKGGAS
ncbi:MAG TPA: hypothetical protein VFF73_14420 [Planctomycetota bacterium]|nr:hypothetical protein [Planctomycetota bacterium]